MTSLKSTGASNEMIHAKPLICVDIDNVIAKTDEVMRRVIRAHSRLQVDLSYEDVICFEYWKCRDGAGRRFGKEEWSDIHTEFTRDHLLEIAPFDKVSYYLRNIREKFAVHLATSRLKDGQANTRLWLERNQIPYDELHFATEGTKHLIDEWFVAAVEDDREQGYAFYSKGIAVFLLAHPWNTVGSHSPLRRVDNWEQLTRELLNLNLRARN